jgi:hypothetical protein
MARLNHDHARATADIHGVTGALVGTTDTQTLTNKTISEPTITGSRIIAKATAFTAVGAAAVTIESANVFIISAGIGVPTLAAPTAQQAGTEITFISTTANAHVVTCTGATLQNGVTANRTTATMAAVAGASITLVAIGVLWYVKSQSAAITYA